MKMLKNEFEFPLQLQKENLMKGNFELAMIRLCDIAYINGILLEAKVGGPRSFIFYPISMQKQTDFKISSHERVFDV